MKIRKGLFAALLIASLLLTGMPELTAYAEEKTVVAEAEVISTGDLLISSSILSASKVSKNNYDFSDIFQYVKPYVEDADYAVINLETSVASPSKGYKGFPTFNTPASVIDDAQDAGFDMFLTASNHSYDHSYSGLIYKIDQLEKRNADYIGTRSDTSDAYHKVVEVNGIKIGMLNYTKMLTKSTSKKIVLNETRARSYSKGKKIVVGSKGKNRIAMYHPEKLTSFGKTLIADISELKMQGAEVIVAYPHWGTEYNISYRSVENKIAQMMCDYGVDVIIGGHPHVVEPTKVYTSKVSGKTTICLHSMGNFVSSMSAKQKKKNAAYTEDGVLFKYVVQRYEDGTVAVSSAEVIPTWVKKYSSKQYSVIPLDTSVDWEEEYKEDNYSKKKSSGYQSYIRTTSLVSEGIEKFNSMAKIYKQPSNISVKSGMKAIFTVKANGEGLEYQWQYSGDNGETWENLDSSAAKLVIDTEGKEGTSYYRCKVSSQTGTAYSKKAKLTIK